jgi:hypothetical protein
VSSRLSLACALVLALVPGGCRATNPAYEGVSQNDDAGSAVTIDARAALDRSAAADLGRAPDLAGDRSVDRTPDRAPAAAPTVTCPTDPDLMLCLRFEGGAKDESPNALAMTTTGAAYEAGLDGEALSSNAQTRVHNLETKALDVTTEVTIEAWVKLRVLPATGQRYGIVDYQRQWSLWVLPGGGVTCSVITPAEFTADALIQPGVWTSVACTGTSNQLTIWINGVARTSHAIDKLPAASNTAYGIAIGGNIQNLPGSTPDQLDGWLDNLRVWRHARTQAQLCASAVRCP